MKNNDIIDEIDFKIIKLLQDDARASVKAIAENLFLSAPTVKSRMDALKEKGIIKGYYVEIDNSVFSNVIKCYVEIEVDPKLKNELYDILKNSPQVIECERVTGEFSLIAKVIFKNTIEMDKFINKIQFYGKTRTQIIFSTIINRRGVSL